MGRTWQKRASFFLVESESGCVERQTKKSGERPAARKFWTECCGERARSGGVWVSGKARRGAAGQQEPLEDVW